MKKEVAILIFDDVEVMDFAGPFEVFSVTNELQNYELMDIKIVAESKGPVTARNGLSINPDLSLGEVPRTDILIIPGGDGTRPLMKNEDTIRWVRKMSDSAELVLSICSGSLILAKSGLLKGLKATTHHQVLAELAELAPETEIIGNIRYVDNGKVITSAGISAGIDMSLHVIRKIYGEEIADSTARYMEYRPLEGQN